MLSNALEKWATYRKRKFPEERVQISNCHIQRCSNFLVFRARPLAAPSHKLRKVRALPPSALNKAKMLGFTSHFRAGFQPHQIIYKLHNARNGAESGKCKFIMKYCFISIKLAKTWKELYLLPAGMWGKCALKHWNCKAFSLFGRQSGNIR